MTNWKHGNLINLFYWDGSSWKALAYGQSHTLSRSAETTDVSSKDHGIWSQQLTSSNTWSMSGEYLFSPDNVRVIQGMADKGEEFTICMAVVSQSNWSDGLNGVTNKGNTSAWTIGEWAKYGNALVTSCDITADNGSVATVSVEFTGSGGLTDEEPTEKKAYNARLNSANPGDEQLDPEGDDVTGNGD